MRAILLAGGFGTRLEAGAKTYKGPQKDQVREWIIGKSKGLVPIQGKPIVGYQLEQLLGCGVRREDIYIHSNQKFFDQYQAWAESNGIPTSNVFSNGVTTNEKRLEQVKDMLLAIKNVGTDKPLFLFAYDTLVHKKQGGLYCFRNMLDAYRTDGMSRVTVYEKGYDLHKHGIVQTDTEGRVIGFEEKPANPKSNLCNASIYFLDPTKLQEMLNKETELAEMKNPLQVVWNGFKVEVIGQRVDIGHIDDVLKHNNVPRNHIQPTLQARLEQR